MSICKDSRDWRVHPHLFIKAFRKSGDYDRLLESQAGICAICGSPPKKKGLSVDHDHDTGQIRGLLCPSCNVVLGFIDNAQWFEKAILYKTNGRQVQQTLENYPPPTQEQFRETMSRIAKEVQNRPDVAAKRNKAQKAAMRRKSVRKRMSVGRKAAWDRSKEKG